MMRLGNYWTKVDDVVYLGCAPMEIFNHPTELNKLGVEGVVNMCYEYPGPVASYDKLGMKQLRMEVVDHEEPSVEQLKLAVSFISSYKQKGRKVYVHCKAGHGRGAAVALAWLIHENPETSPKVQVCL